MPASTDAAIRRGLCACFPNDREHFASHRDWHGSVPAWSVVLEEGTEVVAHAAVVDRVIDVGGLSVHVAGVLNVFVLPEWRGKWLVHRVMSAAMEEARRREFDCGLLFCVPALEKVYARTGWRTLSARRITRVDEEGRELPLPGDNLAMFHPLAMADFPAGDIHLRGNDW